MDTQTKQTSHTPGPWSFDDTREYFNGPVIRMNGVKIAALLRNDVQLAEFHANARLIAAAPRILERLQITNRALLALNTENMPEGVRWTIEAVLEHNGKAIEEATSSDRTKGG